MRMEEGPWGGNTGGPKKLTKAGRWGLFSEPPERISPATAWTSMLISDF